MRWIVRVYALIPDEWGRYLVLEEYFQGGWITKFPGGGVQSGEGLIDALRRELQEELATTPAETTHFYTTDFFQRSYYHTDARLLAVYYRVKLRDAIRPMNPRLRLRWLPPTLMALTFPVDRHVCRLLLGGTDDAPRHSAPASGDHPDHPPPPAAALSPHG